jgi:hypothetical protein
MMASMKPVPEAVATRRCVYNLIITLAAGLVAGNIASVARLYEPHLFRDPAHPDELKGKWPATRPEPTPTQGDNDRSRWDTVRALVDDRTYVIGHRGFPPSGGYEDSGYVTQDGWKTIDKVLHPVTHDFYSSKPPLLPTLVAGEYWLLKKVFGWSIVDDRWEVVRIILLTINWLPLIVYLVLLSRLLDRLGQTDWGRFYVLGAAAFGTFLTTFANTFNNHSIAAYSALFALYPFVRIWEGEECPGLYLLMGFFAGFTATSELPAAVLLVLLLGLLLIRSPLRTLVLALPAAAVPVAAFLVTNYLAIGEWQPAYEKFGSVWYDFDGSHWKIDPNGVPRAVANFGQAPSALPTLVLYVATAAAPQRGIDWAYLHEGPGKYALNLLVGHHGIFSLTPVFLLTAAGLGLLIFRAIKPEGGKRTAENPEESVDRPESGLQTIGLLTLVLSVIVIGFYVIGVNERNRNYGGWTTGLRWLIWLTPFWLLSMLPAVDWLGRRRWGRGLALGCLALSVLSASFSSWTPWRHPWLYRWLESHGWITY